MGWVGQRLYTRLVRDFLVRYNPRCRSEYRHNRGRVMGIYAQHAKLFFCRVEEDDVVVFRVLRDFHGALRRRTMLE